MTEKVKEMKNKKVGAEPDHDNTSPEALSILKCPFNTISEPKDSVPAEFTEKVKYLQGGQNGAPYTGYYAMLNNALVSVSNIYGVWFEVRLRENKFKCFRLARSKLRLKNDPLPGIDFILLKRTGTPTWPPTRPLSCTGVQPTQEQPRESGSKMLSTEQMATLFSATAREALEKPPSSYDDPSSDEEEEPKYKDPFGSFGVRSLHMACGKEPCQP